jgi:hypothetical protein
MERELKYAFLISVLLAAMGCGETGALAGSGGSGGSGGMVGTPALDPLGATPRYAVVSSDFSSSSIAMLDEGFGIIDESWVNSGTTYAGLVATLSGDVVLPTRQAGDGTFAVIDRFSTDVVTRFFVPSGNLNGQVRTHGDVGDTGFSSNPQDLIFVDPDSAWVPRYQANLDPSAPPESLGNDLFEINPADMSATGARIDLSSLNATATVATEEGPVEVEVFARPSRGVLIGSTVLVGLDRISAGFDAAGSGMVAVVDLEDGSVEGLELPGLKSCGRVVPVPGASAKVVVACIGYSQPFGDEAQIRASSGLAVLDVGESGATIEQVWRAADDPASAIAVNSAIALDAERVVGVANGDFATATDALYVTDLGSGAQELVHESAGSFVVGVSAYDTEGEILYVPDAAENVVIELAATAGGFVEVGSTAIAPSLALPPTQIYELN